MHIRPCSSLLRPFALTAHRRFLRPFRLVAMMALSVLASAPVAAHKGHSQAHEHGAAQLEVVIDGTQVHLHLQTPLDNLVGFEHAPRTPAHHEALSQMETRLNEGHTLFVFPEKAGCTPVSAHVRSPYPSTAEAASAHAPVSAPPAVLPPPAKTPDTETTHAHEAHADLSATWVFACTDPAALTQVELTAFKVFSRLKRVDAKVVGPKGQGAASLTPRRAVWRF
jgi:hypothetical protein